jgi:acetyltransferase-like isoleucine patch superfamily enzyme
MIACSSQIAHSAKIHESTYVWHFAVILGGVEIGENCSIGSHTEIGFDTKIGKGSRIGAKVFLPSGTIIGENVFIGPSATFCDDDYPRADQPNYTARPPVIKNGATIGAGAVVLPGVTIGEKAMVGAGAIVTGDVPPGAVVRCDPARVTRIL